MIAIVVLAVLAQVGGPATEVPDVRAKVTLVVQAVDPLWLPIPGAVVTARARSSGNLVQRGTSDALGFAALEIPHSGTYTVEITHPGFKKGSAKGVPVDAMGTSISHVQVRLKLSGPFVTTE